MRGFCIPLLIACIVFLYSCSLGLTGGRGTTDQAFHTDSEIPDIRINTAESSITINGKLLQSFSPESIKEILGTPDRIKKYETQSRFERFGFGDNPPSSTMVTVYSTYYIYDKLGLMFYTQQKRYAGGIPVNMSIFFSNERSFTNTEPLPFLPKEKFNGTLYFNGVLLDPDVKLVPQEISYRTEEFKIADILFGPTSIATVIDGFYSISSHPYIRLFLDDPDTQKISYITVTLKE